MGSFSDPQNRQELTNRTGVPTTKIRTATSISVGKSCIPMRSRASFSDQISRTTGAGPDSKVFHNLNVIQAQGAE